ncbi:hypothetical protein DQ04_08981030 [Trypanosoma grayi]|uniref:hypothetical protein n=1 Tax=Trypanosoma grayi TaxID=71804 RepID=UPI0004F4BCC2|nr:hypothetical protein DQ04_08981030 [Trypanosoma grayi]KEG07725.1 hypothetical protein DQ04_08981030 [Trypanosoma grayi]
MGVGQPVLQLSKSLHLRLRHALGRFQGGVKRRAVELSRARHHLRLLRRRGGDHRGETAAVPQRQRRRQNERCIWALLCLHRRTGIVK